MLLQHFEIQMVTTLLSACFPKAEKSNNLESARQCQKLIHQRLGDASVAEIIRMKAVSFGIVEVSGVLIHHRIKTA